MTGIFATTHASDQQVADFLDWAALQRKHPSFDGLSYIQKRHHLSLSGTAAATIMGVNPWQTVDDLIAYMNWEIPEKEQSFAMARGVALEDTIRQQCVKTLHLTEVQKDVNLNRPENPEREDELWSTCQIDTLAKWGEEPVILEIKTAARNQRGKGKAWGKGCKFNEHGQMLVEDSQIPTHYLMQVQKQMDLSGVHHAFVAVLIDGDPEPRIFSIPFDPELAEQIAQTEVAILFNHIIPNVKTGGAVTKTVSLPVVDEPAPPVETAMSYDQFQKQGLESVYADYVAAKAKLEGLKEAVDIMQKSLREGLGKFTEVRAPSGKPFITLTKYTRRTFDSKALSNDNPELYKKYLKETEAERFTIKEIQ